MHQQSMNTIVSRRKDPAELEIPMKVSEGEKTNRNRQSKSVRVGCMSVVGQSSWTAAAETAPATAATAVLMTSGG